MKVQIYEGQQARISGGRAGGLGRGSLSGLFMETVRSPPVQEARPQARGPPPGISHLIHTQPGKEDTKPHEMLTSGP